MLDIKSVRSPVPCGHWSYTHTWIRTHKDPHIQLIQTQKDVRTHPLNTQRWTHTFTNRCLIKLPTQKGKQIANHKMDHHRLSMHTSANKTSRLSSKAKWSRQFHRKQQPKHTIIIRVHTLHLKEKTFTWCHSCHQPTSRHWCSYLTRIITTYI